MLVRMLILELCKNKIIVLVKNVKNYKKNKGKSIIKICKLVSKNKKNIVNGRYINVKRLNGCFSA